MKPKSIPTEYRGHMFRSRLEARWAIVFDCMGIDWEYESEGFEFDDGTKYLPDFLLHEVAGRNGCMTKDQLGDFENGTFAEDRADSIDGDVYVEVKGPGRWDEESVHKVRMLARHHPVYCVGKIPYSFDDMDDDGNIEFNFETVDGDVFGAAIGVNFYGEVELFGNDLNYKRGVWIEPTNAAFRLGSSARFEHGEHPNYGLIELCKHTVRAHRATYEDTMNAIDDILTSLTDDEKRQLEEAAKTIDTIAMNHGLDNLYVESYDRNHHSASVNAIKYEGKGFFLRRREARIASEKDNDVRNGLVYENLASPFVTAREEARKVVSTWGYDMPAWLLEE